MPASNPIPSAFFGAGYTETGTGVTHQIVLNSNDHATPLLLELTEAEADPTTGDYRKILFSIMEMLRLKLIAATPVATKVSMSRSSYEDTATGELVRTYVTTIRTVPTGIEVADEA